MDEDYSSTLSALLFLWHFPDFRFNSLLTWQVCTVYTKAAGSFFFFEQGTTSPQEQLKRQRFHTPTYKKSVFWIKTTKYFTRFPASFKKLLLISQRGKAYFLFLKVFDINVKKAMVTTIWNNICVTCTLKNRIAESLNRLSLKKNINWNAEGIKKSTLRGDQ